MRWVQACSSPGRSLPQVLSSSPAKLATDCLHSMVLETGIFISQAIWLYRVRDIRREAKKAGMSYDEYMAKIPRSESQNSVVDVEACRSQSDADSDVKTGPQEKCEAAGQKERDRLQSSTVTIEQSVLVQPPVAVTKNG